MIGWMEGWMDERMGVRVYMVAALAVDVRMSLR